MSKQEEPLWTIAELGAQVALALSVDYQGAPNGRVRDVPDPRTIRYYTTLGLLDRPALMRGRTALYGRKHLRQLCAIKRLQARGLALAEIQQQLVGITARKLQDLAQVPADLEPIYVTSGKQAETPTPERAGAFWKMAPAALAAAAPEPALTPSAAGTPRTSGPIVPLQGIALGEGLTLLLAAERQLYEDDISALRVAAAPLLKLLEKRRLIGPRTTKGDDHGQNGGDPDR
jgi:DNA-binding transcriptional MerR regulator